MDLQVMEEARKSLGEFGVLTLPIRKKLWLEYGKIDRTSLFAVKTDALRKRVFLAMECINKVKDIWKENEIIDLSYLIQSINDYLEDIVSAETLMEVNNKFRESIEEIAYSGAEEIGVVGLAVCYVANIALYDELIVYNTDEEDLDEDLDSFTWDTSYLISLVWAVAENIDEGNRRRIEYWQWYMEMFEKILNY